jgi:hypothetical protein
MNRIVAIIACSNLVACHLMQVKTTSGPEPSTSNTTSSSAPEAIATAPDKPPRKQRASMSEITYAWRSYEAAHRELAADLRTLSQITETSPRVEITYLPALERLAKSTRELDDLAAQCKTEPFASGRKARSGWDVGDYCELALDHRARLRTAVATIPEIASRTAVSRAKQALAKDETVDLRTIAASLFPDDSIRVVAARAYAVLGETAPATATAKLEVATTALDARLREVATQRSPGPLGPSHPEATRGAQQVMARSPILDQDKLRLARVWLTDTAWRTDFHGNGKILGRFKNVAALVKVTGKPYCFLSTGVIEQDYLGGGGYAKTAKTNIAMIAKVVRCK